MVDIRLVEDRMKILRETREVLYKLSKKSGPKGLTSKEQSELKRYDKWLGSACNELAKLSKKGEKLLKQAKEVEKMQQSFNLQYLQLQQDMQKQNRQFTLVSNIMKVKHDTAKSAINNVR